MRLDELAILAALAGLISLSIYRPAIDAERHPRFARLWEWFWRKPEPRIVCELCGADRARGERCSEECEAAQW